MKKLTLKSAVSTATSLVALLGVAVIVHYMLKELREGIFNPSQFFMYFTVQAGLLFALVQLPYYYVTRHQAVATPWLQWSRFVVTLYALIIAPIYWGVVQPFGSWQFNDFWLVIHLLLPFTALASWWALPKPPALRWWWPLAALGYPLLFVGISLLRGGLDSWYPYNFLDHQIGGWAGVGQWVAILSIGIGVVGYVLWLTGRRRSR